MGHRVHSTDDLFDGVDYRTKTSPELREAMQRKRTELKERIVSRRARIQRVRDEYSIDAEQLAMLILRYQQGNGRVSYQRQGHDGDLVPAGVIANLIKEQTMIDNEQSQSDKLDLILRNLRDEAWFTHPRSGAVASRPALHRLDDFELEYLGF